MALSLLYNREWEGVESGSGQSERTSSMVWQRIKHRIFPPRPHIPESALSCASFEHQHDSEWIGGWLFLDETGFGFVAQIIAEPLFYIPYSSLVRYNYNRIHHSLPPFGNQPRKHVRDPCFLRFHIRDPGVPVRCLDFRGELESIQALAKDIRKLAYGASD
jgi:hypothetical protein